MVTAAIGYLPWLDHTRPYLLEYAPRTGADFQEVKWFPEIENYNNSNYFVLVEILRRFSEQDYYEELLFLDADILVLPQSPNIFEKTTTIALADDWYLPTQAGHFENWIREEGSDGTGHHPDNPYFNSGVVLMTREVAQQIDFSGPYPARPWYDQDWLNDRLNRLDVEVTHLDRAWNFRDFDDPEAALRNGYFLLFCGDITSKSRVAEFVARLRA